MTVSKKNSDGLFDDTAVCKELFDNANDLIQSVDENGRFLYVNKKWRDVLGYTEEEVLRMVFSDIIHQNHLQACFEAFAEMQKGKSFDNFITQFVAKSGRVIDVSGNISVRMRDGKFVSTWGIFREAIPSSEIEETLRQEQKFSQALIDSLPSIFYVFEVPSLRMVRWNRALVDIFGFSNEETAKMSPIDFIDEQDKRKTEETIRNVIARGKESAEMHVRAKDGSRIPYFFYAVYATIADKKYVVGIGIDITDLRKREEELARANAMLKIRDEQIVKEHELNRAKSEFVSLASHQLKTPLTIIKWYIEMLYAGYAGLPTIALPDRQAGSAKVGDSLGKSAFVKTSADKQKEYLGIIYRNTERMIELIDAFLNVSRLELGIFSIKKEPVNLRDKIELILNNFEPKIKEKSLKLLRNYAKSNFVFGADTKMIQIIFENLVSNAIKYTPHGGEIQIKMSRRKVGISTGTPTVPSKNASGQNGGPPSPKAADGHSKATDGRSNEILIEIIDTGIGIPADQQSKIFTKFFRADNASSYKADGSGLGLYIVKTIVEKIGGKIWFRSPAFAPVAANLSAEASAQVGAKTGKKASAGKPAAADPVRSLARAKGASPKDLGEATSNGADKKGTAFYVTFYPHT